MLGGKHDVASLWSAVGWSALMHSTKQSVCLCVWREEGASLFEMSVCCMWGNICLCECLFAHLCAAAFECILFDSVCQCEHVSTKLAGVRLYVYATCLLSTYKWTFVCMCVCVSLPSAWVATLSAAELSPCPLLLWATTLKRYLVSGMRFWMVTCISPGRLVFTTRSLIRTHTHKTFQHVSSYVFGLQNTLCF